jgi:hypothetical protein
MKAKDIKINKTYGVKGTQCTFKVLEILKPKEKENTNKFILLRGLFCYKSDTRQRYLKLEDIYNVESEGIV